jgi:hypothetical protein
MSDKPKNKPEGADWNSPTAPAAPPPQPDPSPEDVNITPQTTPQQLS